MFYYFEELTSTIDEARDSRYLHGDVIVAERQTAGRGQRGKTWSSPAGENLTFSVVLDTSFLRADRQFSLLQSVALALTDTFASYGLAARIKWPNDIYIGSRKIVGVLIDHSLGSEGMLLSRSSAGIGINVNQRTFDPLLPNPTSMSLETGLTYDLREVLDRFHSRLMSRFGGLDMDAADYHSLLYLLDTPAPFALPDGTRFTGTIRGVGPGGELTMETSEGIKTFLFHELSFVLPQ